MMGVQNRHEWREFNVMRAVRRVNIDVDEFVVNNTNMSDVDFKMCPWDMRNVLESSEMIGLEGENIMIILFRGVIICTKTIILNLVEICIQLSWKYQFFKGSMNLKFI
jgi:hypothetical protein